MHTMDKNTDEGKRVCKRCLLRESNETEYREKLLVCIEKMDVAIRAEEQLYEKRLLFCKECGKLNVGTCTACGCYVELRAAVKASHCPYKKW